MLVWLGYSMSRLKTPRRAFGCEAAAPVEAAIEPPSSSTAAGSAEQGDAQKRKREGARASGVGEEEERPRPIKWKKLIAEQLRNATDSRMSIKKLTKAVLKTVRAKPAAASMSDDQLAASLLAQVRGSSKFALLDGKHVSLSN
jgi:type II secretory pathway component HofQ